MHLTISNEIIDQIYGPLEVSDDMNLLDLVALLEVECNLNIKQHDLYLNMDILDMSKGSQTLTDLNVKDDDLLFIRKKINLTENIDDKEYVESFRKQIINNQYIKQQLSSQIPNLDNLLNDPQLFYDSVGELLLQNRNNNFNGQLQPSNPYGIPQDEYNKLMKNPENSENKKRLDELNDQRAIDEQLRNAYEYTPEIFTTVSMLYVNLEINGIPVKAFVDSGAQMTIMSTRLADKCGLTKSIDKRFIGEARGVGIGKIIGRIHQAQIKIETRFIPTGFVVLDTQLDLLIGLDMLKRHQACIDLEKNVLRIAGVETPFLSEAEIPKDFENEVTRQVAQDVSNNTPAKSIPSLKTSPTGIESKQNNNSNTLPNTSSIANQNNVISNAAPKTQNFPEVTIKQLMDLGFSRAEVIKALTATGGNPDYAAAYLFQ